MSEIFKYNSTAMYYFQLLGKQAGSTVSMTHAGSSGSGRQILGLGLESRIPEAPNRAGKNAGTRGPNQARERANPSKVEVLSLLPHLSLYLRKSPGIR